MQKQILSSEQIELIPLLKKIKKDYGLVGGTAIALHLGHRRSIDFDLFSDKEFKNIVVQRQVKSATDIDKVLVNRQGEFTFLAKGVKITFFHYPFTIDYNDSLDNVIKMPNLLTLAAMKAYALGKRAKWKDYADLYFIIKDYFSIDEINSRAVEIFGTEYNAKIFRTQLSYFDDINYGEKIEFMPGFEISEAKVKKELEKFSLA